MNIEDALKIARTKKCNNGIFICVDAQKGEFNILPLDRCNMIRNGKVVKLGDYLDKIEENQEKLLDAIKTLQEYVLKSETNAELHNNTLGVEISKIKADLI